MNGPDTRWMGAALALAVIKLGASESVSCVADQFVIVQPSKVTSKLVLLLWLL